MIGISKTDVASALTKQERPAVLSFLAILVVFLIYTYFPGDKIAILSNDQLDGFLPAFEAIPGTFESLFRLDKEAERHLTGISLNALGDTELSFRRLIATLFPPYLEFSIFFFSHLIALYLSTFYLVKQVFEKLARIALDKRSYTIIALAAFAITAYPHGAAILGALVGFNLFMSALIRSIDPDASITSVATLFVLSGLFGSFVLGGFFYIAAGLVLATAIALFRGSFKKAAPRMLGGTLIVLLLEYRVFLGVLFPAEPSHRDDWLDGLSYSFGSLFNPAIWQNSLENSYSLFTANFAHYHYQWNTANISVISITVLITLYLAIKVSERIDPEGVRLPDDKAREHQLLTLVYICAFSMILVIFSYGVLRSGVLDLRLILGVPFQFERVIVALPFLAALLLSSLCCLVAIKIRISGEPVSSLILCLLLACFAWSNLHVPTERKFENSKFYLKNGSDNPFIPNYTTGSRYAKPLYHEVKDFLGQNWKEEITLTVGHDPMATAYNGFATLDGYFSNYPESYQQKFLGVIAPGFDELDSSIVGRYVGWGNRLNIPIIETFPDKSIRILIDSCEMKRLGGTLLLSMRPIENPEENKLDHIGNVTSPNKSIRGTFHLYRPSDDACARM